MKADRLYKELAKLSVARRERLIEELAAIDLFLERFQAGTMGEDLASSRLYTRLQEIYGLSVGNSPRDAVVEGVTKILKAAGKPLPLSDIHQGLMAEEIRIPGENPSRNLSNILWRSKTFVCETRKYWFADQEWPEATG